MVSAYDRQMRVKQILCSIATTNAVGNPVNRERLLAECQRQWGAARRTVLEYFKELEDGNLIVVEGLDVWTKAHIEKVDKDFWASQQKLKEDNEKEVEDGERTATATS